MTESHIATIHELVQAIINDPKSNSARQQLYRQVKNGRYFLALYGIPLDAYNALNQQQVFVSQQLMKMPIRLAMVRMDS